jgi:hypothetical protein
VGGGVRTSGYHWPSKANAQSFPWIFEDNISHNCREYGIFVWQNTASERHGIDRFVAYSNGLGAFKHGAYNNRGYHYRNCVFFGNRNPAEQNAQVTVPERNLTKERLSFEKCAFDDDEPLWLYDHNLPPSMFTLYLDSSFAGTILVADDDRMHGWYDFVRCGVTESDFDTARMHANSIIRVQDADNNAFEITRSGTRSIAPFYDGWTSVIPKPGQEFPDWEPSCQI